MLLLGGSYSIATITLLKKLMMNSYLSFFRLCVSIKSILMSWEQQEKK